MTLKAEQAQDTLFYTFLYDPEHNRLDMDDQAGNVTFYLNDPASNVVNERYSSGGTVTWRSYIVADGKIVGPIWL